MYEFYWYIKDMIDIKKCTKWKSSRYIEKVHPSVRQSFKWRLRCLSYNDAYSKAYSLFRSRVL